jgi:dTDP-4-dehydrorhamnose 3,5-epimerase-like enzyme
MPSNIVRWIDVQHVVDERGLIGVIEESALPFLIRRVFFMSRVPAAVERGGHAHPHTDQLAVALSGDVTIETFDGEQTRSFHLQDETKGLYIPRMTWTRLLKFSSSAAVVVLASTAYVPADVIRDRQRFLNYLNDIRQNQ